VIAPLSWICGVVLSPDIGGHIGHATSASNDQ
jgi:hypothetical protein